MPASKGGLCETCKVRRKMSGSGRRYCNWCWLDRQPIEVQVMAAIRRLLKAQSRERFMHTKIMPKNQWDPGCRWCAGCQWMVPLRYCNEGSSRCKACDWKARRDAHVEREFKISREEYWQLWNWQGGRCYMCGRLARQRALAVDHCHTTGKVRGLLCAHNEWGCNVSIMGRLRGIKHAEQILSYVQKFPLDRMRDGEPPPDLEIKNPVDYI